MAMMRLPGSGPLSASASGLGSGVAGGSGRSSETSISGSRSESSALMGRSLSSRYRRAVGGRRRRLLAMTPRSITAALLLASIAGGPPGAPGATPSVPPPASAHPPAATSWPGNPERWSRRYTDVLGDLAAVAAVTGAQRLVIGSELSSLDGELDRWRPLVERMRGLFKGTLVYSANWDHYKDARLFELVDEEGITGYFNLRDGVDAPADDAALEAGWRRVRDQLSAWRGPGPPAAPPVFPPGGPSSPPRGPPGRGGQAGPAGPAPARARRRPSPPFR